MSKKSFQDVVKIKRINKDILPKKVERIERVERVERETEHKEIPFDYRKEHRFDFHEEGEKTNNSKYALWFVALISVVFLLFSISFLFAKAKVTVEPKTKDLVLNESLSAIKDSNPDGLSFDLIAISGEESKTVQGGELKDVSIKAKGTVIIYNAFSTKPQPLNIDTRLEGSNGKMYKTDAKVTVPGITKEGKPGFVEVGIYGIDAGAEYNSDPLDFKVFGFKGTPKYSKVFARSKTKITGGLKGKVSQITDTEKETITNDLKTTLQAKLFKKATDQIPSGFILFKDAVFLNIDDQAVNLVTNSDQSSVVVKGTLYGFLFDEKKLTSKIVEANIDKYAGSEVYISKIRDLSFNFENKENISFGDVKNINFTLTGNVKVVWKVDTTKLTEDLLGSSKEDFNNILSKYLNISSADLVLRPVWKSSLPTKKEKISILINYPL